ncbi:MAG: InlB B-repeat-containing protein [Clostridia bacterium]|nr:InlB B-repeat-containing protein [Clostridia bacterium]
MKKKVQIYEIFMIAISSAIIFLLLSMGITAIQKAMRLNVGLTVTPIAKVELYITPEGGSETLLLRNFSEGGKDVATGSGVTFSNNTVSYSGTYNDFTIRAVNFTDSTPLLLNLTGYGVDIEGEETYQQTLGVANSANSSFAFNLTSSAMMPGTNNATLKMQFVVNSAKLGISTTGCTYTGGASTLSEENPSTYINFTLENAYQSGYALNYNITGVESGGYTWNQETGYFAVTDWSKVTSNIVVSAYVSKLYTVTLDSTGGSLGGSNTITGTAGSELGALLTPSKAGYVFKGWFTSTSGGTQVTSTSQIPENGATYYAQWTPITYTITYNNPDNSGGSTASSTHTYDVAQNLTANGFTAPIGKRFSGWAETSGGAVKYTDGQSVNNLTTTNGATINLYAVWEDVNVSITYNLISCDTSIEEYPTTIPYMNNRENLVLNFYGYDYDTSHSSPNSWGTFYNPPLTVTIGTVIMAKDTDFSYRIWSKGYGDDILTLTINASVITSDIVIDLTCNGSRVCCVSADTMITLSDGSEKRADEIQIGDLVMTYNFETGELEGKPILSITNALRTMQVVLKFSDNTFIKISNDHPLLTELGWKAYHPSACEFAYGDMIKVCEESFVLGDKLFSISTEYNKEIVDIEFEYCEGETFKMYTFMVEDNHNYFSNNVLSHNVACPI